MNGPTILNEQQSNDSNDECFEDNENGRDAEQGAYHNHDEEEYVLDFDEEQDEDGIEYEMEYVYISDHNGEQSSHHARFEVENNHQSSIPSVVQSNHQFTAKKRRNINASLPPPPSPKQSRKTAKLIVQKPTEQFTLQLNECLICPAILGDIIQLKEHIEAHSDIQCKACHREFVRYSNLKRHFNSTHSKPKPFVCDWCGLGFNFSANLQSHAALHSSGKIIQNDA